VFYKHFRDEKLLKIAVASPGVGVSKMARGFAKRFDADLIIIDKRRPAPNVAEVMNIIGEPEGKDIILVDDLIDTGGTFTNAAKALMDAGARSVYGACSHAVLSSNAVERIEKSPLKYLLVTDTIPMKKASSKIVVKSVAKLFAEAVRRTNVDKSISSLFDENGKKKK